MDLDEREKSVLAEAQKLLAKASAKKKSVRTVFARMAGHGEESREEAAELYREASTRLAAIKDFGGAAYALEKAAGLDPRPYDAAATLVDAANHRRSAGDLAATAADLGQAAHIFTKRGPQRRAALILVDMAKVFDEMSALDDAVRAWRAAATAAETTQTPALAAKARKGLGYAAARVGEYHIAIQSFEPAIAAGVNDRLSRWGVKSLMFNTGLCYAANGDTVGLTDALGRWEKLDRAFNATPEHKCLRRISVAIRDRDEPTVERALYEYDKQHRLDRWQVDIGLKVKAAARELL